MKGHGKWLNLPSMIELTNAKTPNEILPFCVSIRSWTEDCAVFDGLSCFGTCYAAFSIHKSRIDIKIGTKEEWPSSIGADFQPTNDTLTDSQPKKLPTRSTKTNGAQIRSRSRQQRLLHTQTSAKHEKKTRAQKRPTAHPSVETGNLESQEQRKTWPTGARDSFEYATLWNLGFTIWTPGHFSGMKLLFILNNIANQQYFSQFHTKLKPRNRVSDFVESQNWFSNMATSYVPDSTVSHGTNQRTFAFRTTGRLVAVQELVIHALCAVWSVLSAPCDPCDPYSIS